jgi:membrane-associated phospholipid phosphatase
MNRRIVAALAWATLLPVAAGAEPPTPAPLRLERRDALLAGTGLLAGGIGRLVLDPDPETVPASGLDRDDIAWGWDRRAVGPANPSAISGSDLSLAVSLVLPAIGSAMGPPSGRANRIGRLWRVQGEAVCVAAGLVYLTKPIVSRPRPYTYLSDADRPGRDGYDVDDEDAFSAFPSGHAAVAWASAVSGVGVLATERPDLPAAVHFAAGVLAGGFATATGLLRVESGQHFPTDVAAGSLLGAASGAGFALLHRDRGTPTTRWRPGLLGLAAGVGVALLLTPPTSPWID